MFQRGRWQFYNCRMEPRITGEGGERIHFNLNDFFVVSTPDRPKVEENTVNSFAAGTATMMGRNPQDI